MPHPDVATEQAHLDRAATALAQMADRTRAVAEATAAATEADGEVAAYHLRRRLESLESGDHALAFGRIDESSDRWYVGRRHIEDGAGDPIVVDWRAPVSIPFYRATVHDPLGLDVRRRFLVEGATLLDILEEDFNDPDAALVSGGIPDPLLAELERERTGSMRDIVATIAAEQDEIIRTPLDRLLVVQGGPGTGKTAVALHRAAYLLFEHRLELLDRGVLVIGPNPLFLSYVADVLPSLGETAVRQTTIEQLRPPAIRLDDVDDDPEVGRLKGDGRMAEAIAQALRTAVRIPTEPVAINTEWGVVRLSPDDVAEVVAEVQARGATHATAKEALRSQLLHRAYRGHERSAEVPALKANFVAGARRDPGFRTFVDSVWPTLSAPAIVHGLLSSPVRRRRGVEGILDPDEAALLARETPRRVGDVRWRATEIPLLDEADAQLNGTKVSYGHVIADEAQDLSTMALRMLARRALGGSMTIVGDLAQGTRAWAAEDWGSVAEVLAGDAPVVHAELTVGYRTPAPILDLANRLLPVAAPGVAPARSIRDTGNEPALVPVASAALVGTVARLAATAASRPGTVAVIAVEADHPSVGEALENAGVSVTSSASDGTAISLLTPLLAKGLEFDEVIVVEPARIVEAEPSGHRALFVSLTRPTRQLVIVHAEPLPNALT